MNRLAEAAAAFHFLRPAWLLALPLLWAAAAWLARRRARDGDWSALIDADLLDGLRLADADDGSGAGAAPSRPWHWLALALAWTLAVLALAGPSWSRDSAPGYRAPAAWVLVLDLSPSMAAADLAPNRFTRARYAIEDLLAAAHDARVALVVFGEEAFAVVPLTDDVQTVRSLLAPLAPPILPVAGDRLAPALARAGALLAGTASRHGHVVVLSDGFADPAAALQAAAALRGSGERVDVVGIGTAGGAPVPAPDGGFVAGSGGQPRLARLDAPLLQRLAATGGGRYVELGALPALIAALQAEGGPQRTTAPVASAAAVELSRWRDGGVWLLPALVLVAAALARRGGL